jgi:gp15|uniref:Repressor domain protein n=2 Tax=root TaxID=1 RepID=A0A8S5NC12_9CAUD|nr:MAG TPA: repressor domain protein [Siphoviridae sp. ctfZQ2]
MNEIFNFHGQEVRTVIFDNEPWFVAKDVADILGYQNGSRDINRHVDEDDKLTSQVATAGQMRNQTVINESGLYSLILSSKLPQAKEFKRWVTSEVLPAIRKQGGFIREDLDEDAFIALFTGQKKLRE